MATSPALWITTLVAAHVFAAVFLVRLLLLCQPRLSHQLHTAFARLRLRQGDRSSHGLEDTPSHRPLALARNSHERARGPPRTHNTTLEWRDVGCSYQTSAGHKVVLQGCSGRVDPGTLHVLLGPSGAGKTSLMDILAHRKQVGQLSGHVLLNGLPSTASGMAKASATVPQDDNFMPVLTALETLRFHAAMRLDPCLDSTARDARCWHALEVLGLAHCAHTMVGGLLPGGLSLRGLSGGERKRLAVGVGLLGTPALLFLDEPTSGLDSYAALSVMRYIRGMVDGSRHAVIASIHQPRSSIWSMVDAVTVLSHGLMLYTGPRDSMVPWFTRGLSDALRRFPTSLCSHGSSADSVAGSGSHLSLTVFTSDSDTGRAGSSGAPEAETPGRCSGEDCAFAPLRFTYEPERHGVPSDWVMDLVSLGFAPVSKLADDAGAGAGTTDPPPSPHLTPTSRPCVVAAAAGQTKAPADAAESETYAAKPEASGDEKDRASTSEDSTPCAAFRTFDQLNRAAQVFKHYAAASEHLPRRVSPYSGPAPVPDMPSPCGTSAEGSMVGVGDAQGPCRRAYTLPSVTTPAVAAHAAMAAHSPGCAGAEQPLAAGLPAVVPPTPSKPTGPVARVHSVSVVCYSPTPGAAAGGVGGGSVGATVRVAMSPPGPSTAASVVASPRSTVSTRTYSPPPAQPAGVQGGYGMRLQAWGRKQRRHMAALLWREATCITRNPADVAGRMLTFAWVAVLAGLVFYNLPSESFAGAPLVLNVQFSNTSFFLLMPFVSIGLVAADRQYFIADASARLYHPGTYYVSKVLVTLPFHVLAAVAFCLIVAGMTGADTATIGPTTAITATLYLISVQVLHAAVSLTPNQDAAFMTAIGWTAINLLFSGFFIPYHQFAFQWLSQLRWISAQGYAFEGLAQVELAGRVYNCSQGLDTPQLELLRHALPTTPAVQSSAVQAMLSNPGTQCEAHADAILDYYGLSRAVGPTLAILWAYYAVTHLVTWAALMAMARRERR